MQKKGQDGTVLPVDQGGDFVVVRNENVARSEVRMAEGGLLELVLICWNEVWSHCEIFP